MARLGTGQGSSFSWPNASHRPDSPITAPNKGPAALFSCFSCSPLVSGLPANEPLYRLDTLNTHVHTNLHTGRRARPNKGRLLLCGTPASLDTSSCPLTFCVHVHHLFTPAPHIRPSGNLSAPKLDIRQVQLCPTGAHITGIAIRK